MKVHAKVDVYVKLSGTAIIIQIITVSSKSLRRFSLRESTKPCEEKSTGLCVCLHTGRDMCFFLHRAGARDRHGYYNMW